MEHSPQYEGILPVNKPAGCSSFFLIKQLRKILGIKKIGHAGTLDPFATGVMILLIGRPYTRMSDQFLTCDKEYVATLHLGRATDSYDCTGETIEESTYIPTAEEVDSCLEKFQGEILQIPPMFSAKKINGQKLYNLARKGEEVERKPVKVTVDIELLSYSYPHMEIRVNASKGTYIRSLAHDIGHALNTCAHLSALQRTRSGEFSLDDCLHRELRNTTAEQLLPYLQKRAAIPAGRL